jgi:hypothetical protein
VEKWTTRATPLSSETGFFGKRSKAEVKKREITGQFEGVVALFPGLPARSLSGEDDLLGRALHQHKLHFAEVDGLRRDQPSRIFL